MSGRSRDGSALLIVLGMMSFVMVSALAFAAYMRYSRLPSSYLRRTSSSRQLAKAALAEAIDEIDMAIGNNPHPGVGTAHFRRHLCNDHVTDEPYYPSWCCNQPYNTWYHRVFMRAENPQAYAPYGQRSVDKLSDTVSPLCLEALAYIPPPLVNEARFFSRWTDTATWRSFDFDIGRYCYCALDVSDYFDINRLSADLPRSSSPSSRISLGYLFETGEEHTGIGSGADAWDRFMENFRTVNQDTFQVEFDGSKSPLVSLADFNLAYYRNGGDFFKSFFGEYVGTGNGLFIASESTDLEKARRMTFVTDSWFPSGQSASTSSDYDLNDPDNQPFPMSMLVGARQPPLMTVMTYVNSNMSEWRQRLGRIGCAALFDYLDYDHIPISLALPTTERVPMICGIGGTGLPAVNFSITRGYPNGEDVNSLTVVKQLGENEREVEKTFVYKISPQLRQFFGGRIDALTVFPFSHRDDTDLTGVKLDGRFSMFFASEANVNLRAAEAGDSLRVRDINDTESKIDADRGVLSVHIKSDQNAEVQNVTTPETALKSHTLSLGEGSGLQLEDDNNALATIKVKWKQTKQQQGNSGGVAANVWMPEAAAVINDPAANNAVVSTVKAFKMFKKDGTPEIMEVRADNGQEVFLKAAVWLMVKSSDNKVVDMVPACCIDDGLNNDNTAAASLSAFRDKANPLFCFDAGVHFKLSVKELNEFEQNNGMAMGFSPKSAIVADPRFNHAPESWFSVPGDGQLTAQIWLDKTRELVSSGDGDIFMATSDSAYLQSKYELAFLPHFTPLSSYGGDQTLGDLAPVVDMSAFPNNLQGAANADFMWNTYDPFDEEEWKVFEKLPWTSDGNGFKVNPYSDDHNVLMAALANTPVDWKRASTNVLPRVDYSSLSTAEFNKRYAWNAYTTEQSNRLQWRVLEDFADGYVERVRKASLRSGNGASSVFSDAWQAWRNQEGQSDSLWREDSTLCGAELAGAKLWSADRKFLYGYWRDCFAAKQQLFLIFVRAEPTMMGSGAPGQTPPQLGSRAVALVWRDPTPTADDTIPHRTRILFYRQFD